MKQHVQTNSVWFDMLIFVCLQLRRDLLKRGACENMQVGQNDVFLQAELHHFLTITFWRKPKDKNTPLPAKQNSPESSCAECTLLLLIYSFFVLFCQLQYFHISLEHAHFSFKTGSIHPENSHQTAAPEHR